MRTWWGKKRTCTLVCVKDGISWRCSEPVINKITFRNTLTNKNYNAYLCKIHTQQTTKVFVKDKEGRWVVE